MRGQQAPLDWMVPHEVTFDVLVDAEQWAMAVDQLGGGWTGHGSEGSPQQAVLLADCGQLGVATETAEEYRWQQLPARVIRNGQAHVQLRRLALLVKVIMPGIVRVFVEGPLLNVIGTAGQPLNWRACVRIEEETISVEAAAAAWDQGE